MAAARLPPLFAGKDRGNRLVTEYQWDARPDTTITPGGQSCLEAIKASEYAVLVGRNNCGKSYLLKSLTQQIGQRASYLGPARYQNFNVLGYYTPNRNRRNERWNEFSRQWRDAHQNIDNSPLNLQQAIAELSDTQRATLTEIVRLLLGTQLELRHTVSDNSMSQKYISCNGHNISFTSSGFRLITTLVTSLLDTEYDTFLVDEPELGISPEAQGALADFLYDREHRARFFPHIKTLVFATHSTIFLDRRHIANNYSVLKTGSVIDVVPANTLQEFNNIHFFLLGNRLEALYLPACILLTEGKCDHAFLTRVLELVFPTVQFSVICAGSDSRIKEIVSIAGNLFTDLQKSPYRTRIVAVLDSTHGRDVVEMLQRSGIPKEHVVIWSKNGIEYFYPTAVLDQIFGTGSELEINGDIVARNGLSYKKWDLCDRVVRQIRVEHFEQANELREKLLQLISAIVGVPLSNVASVQSDEPEPPITPEFES